MQRVLKCLSVCLSVCLQPLLLVFAPGQAAAAEEQDHRLTAIMSELKLTKEKLENDLFAAQQEKEMLEEQVKNLEHGHRPTQTASICPMAQRTTSQAVVLPTCQMSPEVATVQPSVSVSPEEDNVGIASKEAEEAGTVEKGVNGKMTNLQRPRPLKRKASDTGENLLVSQQKKHKMFLTMIGCGLSKLIEDEDTPERMLGPLEALKHNTTFSSEDEDVLSQKKRRKLPNIQKALKQNEEYFEHDEMKREPMDQD